MTNETKRTVLALSLREFEAKAQAAGWPYRSVQAPQSRYARCIPDQAWPTETLRDELWHLSDWRVSSVSGGTIWMVGR